VSNLTVVGNCFLEYGAPIQIENSLAVGSIDFGQPDEHSCFAYTESGVTVMASNLVLFGFKDTTPTDCTPGIATASNVQWADPGFVAGTIHGSHDDPNYAFDLALAPGSPFSGQLPPLGAQQP
jgi:hypothetical protein